MKQTEKRTPLRRRLLALIAAGCTLWAAAVTAGSRTVSAAAAALQSAASVPLGLLRWELGDLWKEDGLSPATVLAISESPLLISAREEVTKLWSTETPDSDDPDEQDEYTRPVTETPLDAGLDFTDNGVTARTLVPTDPSGYTVIGKTYITNTTDYTLSETELTENFDAELTGDAPQILIIHSHGSESYTPPEGTEITYSGNHRTTDTRYNVVRVGDEMAEVFAEAGISVLHDRTLYDYPSYNEAYDRALAAIETYKTEYPSLRFVLDIHRDAIEDTEGNEYKVVSVIEGQGTAAQMTLVMGSDGSGLEHPQWKENLKLAIALQNQILGSYPTLMRPLLLRNSRYNQHMTTGSLLVEVGAAGNSPDEAALAGRLFAQQMVELLEGRSK
jgi:stage II sporulation protein P